MRNAALSSERIELPLGLPETLVVPLQYSTRIPIDVDVDSDAVFAANGAFDPDITGTGHQPYYFDQFMAIYQRFRVIRSAIEFTYVPVATTSAGACRLGVWFNLSATSLEGSPIYVFDNPGFKAITSNGTGQATPKVTREDDIKTLTQTDTIASALYGSASGNPAVVAYYHCYVATLDTTTNLSGQGFVNMVYLVEFSRRTNPGASLSRPPASTAHIPSTKRETGSTEPRCRWRQ